MVGVSGQPWKDWESIRVGSKENRVAAQWGGHSGLSQIDYAKCRLDGGLSTTTL